MAERIVGLDKAESDLILGYLCDLYEKSVDIQVRFRWTPKTSALWDNRSEAFIIHHEPSTVIREARLTRYLFPESLSMSQAGTTKAPSLDMGQERLRWQNNHILILSRLQEERH